MLYKCTPVVDCRFYACAVFNRNVLEWERNKADHWLLRKSIMIEGGNINPKSTAAKNHSVGGSHYCKHGRWPVSFSLRHTHTHTFLVAARDLRPGIAAQQFSSASPPRPWFLEEESDVVPSPKQGFPLQGYECTDLLSQKQHILHSIFFFSAWKCVVCFRNIPIQK